jgi:DNA-binding NarL/FixJ family response regulator
MNIETKIRLLVVDDHPSVLAGLSAVIGYQDDFELVGQAGSAAEAIRVFDAVAPDVSLIDLALPDVGGIELITILHAKSASARFIVLTANAGGSEIAKAVKAGAHAYLFKNAPFDELLNAIRTVFYGGHYMSPEVSQSADSVASHHLTERELQVLNWIVRGSGYTQIASEVGASEETIKFHVKNIFVKLKVNSRSQAAVLAIQLGLVDTGTPS